MFEWLKRSAVVLRTVELRSRQLDSLCDIDNARPRLRRQISLRSTGWLDVQIA